MNEVMNIENKILVIRGQQVMLDRDLAEIYGVETRIINQAVKRNEERFPEPFCFQLTKNEIQNLKSQFVISSWGGTRFSPYAFTEQGVAMLPAVLRSPTAIKISIEIMNAFVHMRHYLHKNADILNRMNNIENKIDTKFLEYDKDFSRIFKIINTSPDPVKQGVFVKGQCTNTMHDRFLIIDKTVLIHVGASLNYLGKRCFAFSSLDKSNIPDILAKI